MPSKSPLGPFGTLRLMANISGVLVHCCFCRIQVVTPDKFAAADVPEELKPAAAQVLSVLQSTISGWPVTQCLTPRPLTEVSNGGGNLGGRRIPLLLDPHYHTNT